MDKKTPLTRLVLGLGSRFLHRMQFLIPLFWGVSFRKNHCFFVPYTKSLI